MCILSPVTLAMFLLMYCIAFALNTNIIIQMYPVWSQIFNWCISEEAQENTQWVVTLEICAQSSPSAALAFLMQLWAHPSFWHCTCCHLHVFILCTFVLCLYFSFRIWIYTVRKTCNFFTAIVTHSVALRWQELLLHYLYYICNLEGTWCSIFGWYLKQLGR